MDEIYIGDTSPADEDCKQVGYDSEKEMREEGRRFITLIREVCGEEPDNTRLCLQKELHDAGVYYSVICKYDPNNEESEQYAFWVEGYAPTKWDGSGGKAFIYTNQEGSEL